jgi:hypothetical protein
MPNPPKREERQQPRAPRPEPAPNTQVPRTPPPDRISPPPRAPGSQARNSAGAVELQSTVERAEIAAG